MGCETGDISDFSKPYNNVIEPNVHQLLATGVKEIRGEAPFKYWTHQMTYPNHNRDLYDDFDEGGLWERRYLVNKDMLDVMQRTKDSEEISDQKAYALAHIIRSVLFVRLTDSFGDIPYTMAGKEQEDGVTEFPEYDTQESIYKDCFTNLTKAIELIGDEDRIPLGKADFIYHEDLQKWKLFANSVRLRMALRVTNVDATLSSQWFNEVAKYPVINSMDESATYQNFDVEGFRNPLWSAQPQIDRMSKIFVDYLKNTSDPRLEKLVNPNNEGEYVGLVNGTNYSVIEPYSGEGDELTRADRESPILLYDEVCFIKAEMYLRGLGVTKDENMANTWYQKGVEANMKHYAVSDEDITKYMTGEAEATLNGSMENKRRQIGSQKWIGGIDNDFELFADMRRSGYPVIADRVADSDPPVSLGETNGKMPRRLKYPTSELTNNTENYEKANAVTDGNSFLHRVWWDVE
jgi:hypothetical protein